MYVSSSCTLVEPLRSGALASDQCRDQHVVESRTVGVCMASKLLGASVLLKCETSLAWNVLWPIAPHVHDGEFVIYALVMVAALTAYVEVAQCDTLSKRMSRMSWIMSSLW